MTQPAQIFDIVLARSLSSPTQVRKFSPAPQTSRVILHEKSIEVEFINPGDNPAGTGILYSFKANLIRDTENYFQGTYEQKAYDGSNLKWRVDGILSFQKNTLVSIILEHIPVEGVDALQWTSQLLLETNHGL